MSLEGDDLLIVNGVCPRPGEAFTVRVPLRTNPDLDGTVIPVSRHIHHLGTALIAELMLRMYNSVAADIDAYVITNVYPFTLDKVLRPAVTVRRRFDRTLSDARTPVRFDWETWFKGRSKKKVMPRTSRRARRRPDKVVLAPDQSPALCKALRHAPEALVRALELEATIAPSRRILVSLLRIIKLVESIDANACVPKGQDHEILVNERAEFLPRTSANLDGCMLPIAETRIAWASPWHFVDYFRRRYREITTDLDFIYCSQVLPWQQGQDPDLPIAMCRKVAEQRIHYNWVHRLGRRRGRDVMTSSERKQQSWAAHGYEGEALTRWVEDGLVLEQVLALEKVMAPYRAAQSRIDQILRLLEPLMFVTGVPHVPEHEIRVLSGARPRLKLRFGGARYVFPDRCTPGA